MNKKKVLIIEDEKKDYKKIKNNIILQELSSVYDCDGLPTGSLSDLEKEALTKFRSSEDGALGRSMDFIAQTINNNYQEIRLIICDLKINNNNNAGRLIIEMIRLGHNFNFNKPWYGKEIPIVIISNLSNKELLEAFEKSDGKCFFLSKDSALSNDGSATLNSIMNSMARQFDEIYNNYDSIKKYKVALSFTGTNVDGIGKELKIRPFIQEVARALSGKYSTERVFYDMTHQEESNAKDKKVFANTYNNAEYVVVFISEGYKNKKSRWSSAEWEVIKKLDLRKKVIFVAIDSTLKEDEFKSCLEIDEIIYINMLGLCSDYNKLYNVEDSETVSYVKNNTQTMSFTQIAAYAIKNYCEKSTIIIKEAVELIINTIDERESKKK